MLSKDEDGFSVEIHEVSQGFLQKSYIEMSELGDAIHYALVAVRSCPIEVFAKAVSNCNYPEDVDGDSEWSKVVKAEQAFIDASSHLRDVFETYRNDLLRKHRGEVCNANE